MRVKLVGLKKPHAMSDTIRALRSLAALSLDESKEIIGKLMAAERNPAFPPTYVQLDLAGDKETAARTRFSLSAYFQIKYDARDPAQLHLYKVACKFDNPEYQRKTAILLATDRTDAYEAAMKRSGVLEIISVRKINGPFRNQDILYFG
jgi:hypothetical protein